MLLDFHVKAGNRFSLRDKQLFEISEFETARVNCRCFDFDANDTNNILSVYYRRK